MDVRIMHGSTNVSSHTIRYDRETKLCTGIGMLELEVEYTYGGTFDPWDVINIYENGNLAGKYFVSSVVEGQPNSTMVVTAQDNSKRLSDYFIVNSYLIDYPSYTRYWIELFLTEVGLSYTFLTDSQGSILSNNTALGLMSAYEQITQLLQLSGWYITFNASGKAIIGKLDADKAKNKGSMNSSDILEIKVDKNDRMYRNRVVIWGAGDPTTARWVFSDVRKPTKWDYDSRDLRTILISNSNIPTVKDAFVLANQVLLEFAKLNVEKYLTVTGARNFSVGNVVSLKTKVFTGKGMITTFGVSMSSTGLVSHIAMDERCPRLFGFFDPGGYVYVGTFGSGVWRKHILDYRQYSGGAPSGVVLSGLATNVYSGNWMDYSSGLMDMNVTDLHINNAVLSCVTSSGQIYYSLEDETPWSGIVLSGFQVTYSGTVVDPTIYSGLMGRATIIDRDTNFLRYAVDTRSGINQGDFLMESTAFSGVFWYTDTQGNIIASGVTSSGITESGRSWVLDVNPYDGTISGVYPVNMSGNYNYTIYDIENDGSSDYVEVLTLGSGVIPQYLLNGQYTFTNFGEKGYSETVFDADYKPSMSYSGYPNPILQDTNPWVVEGGIVNHQTFSLWDNTPVGNAYAAWTNESSKPFMRVFTVTVTPEGNLTSSTTTATGTIGTTASLLIDRRSESEYQFYGMDSTDIIRYDYNINSLILSKITVCSLPPGAVRLVNGGNLYIAEIVLGSIDFVVNLSKTVLATGETTSREVLKTIGTGPYGTWWSIPLAILFPYGDDDVILECPYIERSWITPGPLNGVFAVRVHRFSQIGFFGTQEIDELTYDFTTETGEYGGTDSFGTFFDELTQSSAFLSGSQNVILNKNRVCGVYLVTVNTAHVVIEDFADSVNVSVPNSNSGLKLYNKRVYNSMLTTDLTLTREGDTFTGFTFSYVDPANGDVISSISDPTGYRLMDFAGTDIFNRELFFRASKSVFNYDIANLEMISINSINVITRRASVMEEAYLSNEYLITAGWRWVSNSSQSHFFYFVRPSNLFGKFPVFEVLQRTGWDYSIVKSGVYQDRLDISNYSPLVTMGRPISSLETYFISPDNSVLTTSNTSMSGLNLNNSGVTGNMFSLGINADDFRYSDFDGIGGSGLGVAESGLSRRLMIVYSGGVGSTDIYTLASFSGEFQSPSGYAKRIEVSNYALPDQYVFIAVSGYVTPSGEWGFFQKSPSYSGYDVSSGVFVDYSSGYPQARTTIIRLDESL